MEFTCNLIEFISKVILGQRDIQSNLFAWSVRIKDGEVWFDVHLESADYYSERDIEDDENVEYESDWKAPIVWGNYQVRYCA